MQYRYYRDQEISVVGFGGICVMNESVKDAQRIVAKAIDRGITYFDVAPSYGNAEDRLGPALQPYRDSVFLACKTNIRDAGGAENELHQSLQKLHTDHFDLYQLHAIETEEQVDQILAPGGVLEFVAAERKRGTVRHIGFSAHNEEAALRLLNAFPFDSVLFPINRFVWFNGEVGPRILDAANRRGAHVLALKALALRRWREGEERAWSKTWYKPVETSEDAATGLRFALSQPGVVAAVSPGHEEFLWWACDAADAFAPLSKVEMETARHAELSGDPVFSQSVRAI